MSTTVMGALLNAQINFENCESMGMRHPLYPMAKAQLDNAIEALKNGMGLNDVIQEGLGGEIKTSKKD